MPARIPRRSFATPFVVTLAAACSSSSPPPTHPPVYNPPPPGDPAPTDPAPTPTEQPPPQPTQGPGIPPMNPPTPPTKRAWQVFKTKDGCMAVVKVDCPNGQPGQPAPTCNPPPAHKYACPDNMSGDSLVVTTFGTDNRCIVERQPVSCPPNVRCNPPPLQYVPCPE